MGKYGARPSDLIFLIGNDILNYILVIQDDSTNKNRLALTYNAGGPNFTIWQGLNEGSPILGMQLCISEFMRNDLNTAGVYDGSTMTKTGFLIFNKRGFAIFDKKAFTLENAREIETFQTKLVASIRMDFQKLYSATIPVSYYGYNVTTGVA